MLLKVTEWKIFRFRSKELLSSCYTNNLFNFLVRSMQTIHPYIHSSQSNAVGVNFYFVKLQTFFFHMYIQRVQSNETHH